MGAEGHLAEVLLLQGRTHPDSGIERLLRSHPSRRDASRRLLRRLPLQRLAQHVLRLRQGRAEVQHVVPVRQRKQVMRDA